MSSVQSSYHQTEDRSRMRQRIFITNPPAEPDHLFATINHMAAEAQQFYSLIAALNIKLFDHLDEPVSLDDLCLIIPHNEMISPLLRILVDCGFISEVEGLYQNTPATSTYFTTHSPYFQGAYLEKIRKKISELWVHLPDVIRNGPVVYDKKEFFCDMCLPPMAENAMTGRLQHVVRSIVAMPEFLSAHKMLDLGGGHGLYSIALASLKPDLVSIVFDLPEVTDTTCDYIIAHDMDEQVKVFPGDFFTDDLGTGYDLILSSSNPSGKKAAMISKIYNALAPGGIFVNIQSSGTDFVDDPVSQLERKMWAVDGEPEWKSHKGKQPFLSDTYVHALRECGFDIKQVEQIPDLCKDDFMMTMIICKKKEQMRPAPHLRISLLSGKDPEQTVTFTVDTQNPDWMKTLSLMDLSPKAEELQRSQTQR